MVRSPAKHAVTLISGMLLLLSFCAGAQAERVCVKYRGCLSLDTFKCVATVSSFVNRVCYDSAQQYMVIKLRDTYYHYCEIPQGCADRRSIQRPVLQ